MSPILSKLNLYDFLVIAQLIITAIEPSVISCVAFFLVCSVRVLLSFGVKTKDSRVEKLEENIQAVNGDLKKLSLKLGFR